MAMAAPPSTWVTSWDRPLALGPFRSNQGAQTTSTGALSVLITAPPELLTSNSTVRRPATAFKLPLV